MNKTVSQHSIVKTEAIFIRHDYMLVTRMDAKSLS